MNMQRSTEGLIQPAEKVQESIIYLLHPNGQLIIPLYRGGIEKTLRRFGYTEVSKQVYDEAQDER